MPAAPSRAYALLAALALAPLVTFSSACARETAPTISRSPDSENETQTVLAVNADGHVAVVWINGPNRESAAIGYAISLDSGDTWSPAGRVRGPSRMYTSDPYVSSDIHGGFRMVFLDDDMGGAASSVWVATAARGTTQFDAPVRISDPNVVTFRDRPTVAPTHRGSTLAVWSEGDIPNMRLVRARSADGVGWERAPIAANDFFDYGYLCPSPTNDTVFYVVMRGPAVQLLWSLDDGVTWNASDATTVFSETDPLRFGDPKCGTDGAHVWVMDAARNSPVPMGDMLLPSADGVRLAYSDDAGRTFTRVTRIAEPAGPLVLRPGMVVEPSGAIDITYYAGRADGDARGSYRWVRSTDLGATFSASVALHAPITYSLARLAPPAFGDYNGLAWHDGALLTSFVDNSAFKSHVRFIKTTTP